MCFLSFEKFAELEMQLGAKVTYTDVKVGEIGFKGIQISGPKTSIKVIPDQDALGGYARMLQMNTWKLYSLGKAPKLLSSDGNKMLRESDADAVEVRVGYYAQLGCSAPGYNGVGLL